MEGLSLEEWFKKQDTAKNKRNNMRVYTLEQLQGRSKQELEKLKEQVQSNHDLTLDEKDKNIDMLHIALNGGVRHSPKDAMELIKLVEPDISDIGE